MNYLEKKQAYSGDIKKYQPIIYEGIPDLNQESISYREFWDEQIERCKNGYKPRGMDAISNKLTIILIL